MANEKRLIDANALMVHMKDLPRWEGMFEPEDVISSVENAPTVDAVEVVHGRWEDIKDLGGGNCFGYCSNCKTPQKASNATALKSMHRYCRWCGAKMDGERKDNDF